MDILIATHGRAASLMRTLQHVISGATAGAVAKVVVVENGGDSGARQVCAQFTRRIDLSFISVPTPNKSNALNQGLRFCTSPLIFMTDDDIEIPTETLSAYAKLEPHGPGIYLGGPVRVRMDNSAPQWVEPYLPRSARGWEIEAKDFEEKEPFLGCNWATFRSDLYLAGGFDPSHGPGSITGATGQETNMQRRLRSLGVVPRYLPGAYVVHDVANDSFTKEWILRRSFRNGVAAGINHGRGDLDGALQRVRGRRRHDLVKAMIAVMLRSETFRFRTQYSRQWGHGFRHGVQLVSDGQIPEPPFLDHTSGAASVCVQA